MLNGQETATVGFKAGGVTPLHVAYHLNHFDLVTLLEALKQQPSSFIIVQVQ